MGSLKGIPSGTKFGRLTVITRAGRDNSSREKPMWLCQCDCGEYLRVRGEGLKSGNTKSCGCLKRESASKKFLKHGHNIAKSPTYRSWAGMINRCSNKSQDNYRFYGGRDIQVCKRWRSFERFLEDMGERPGQEYSIDRKDSTMGYCPENCRWATKKEQSRNRKSNHFVTFQGKSQPISAWAEELGIKPNTLYARINTLKWPIEKALNKPVDNGDRA